MDQEQLRKLLNEKRFQGALELACSIDKELQTLVTSFNYSVCLANNGELEESIRILETLLQNDCIKQELDHEDLEGGIVGLEEELTKDLVESQLLVTFWKAGNTKRAEAILKERKNFVIGYSNESLNTFLEILEIKFANSNYFLQCHYEIMKLTLKVDTRKIEFKSCSISSSIQLPRGLQELAFFGSEFTDSSGISNDPFQSCQDLYSREFIPNTVTMISIFNSNVIIPVHELTSCEYLDLIWCSLNLDTISSGRIRPKDLKLHDVSYFRNKQKLSKVAVNEFIDFGNIKHLELNCCPLKMNTSVDLSQDFISIHTLCLLNVVVLNWKYSKWIIKKCIVRIPFEEKTLMKIKELNIRHSEVNLSCLPRNIEKLSLCDSRVTSNGGIDFPKLKHLELGIDQNTSCLSHFLPGQLTHIHFSDVQDLNVDYFPPSVTQVKITQQLRKANVSGPKKALDKLILEHLSFDEVEKVLTFFQIEELVVYSNFIELDDLVTLTEKAIRRIAIGAFEWKTDSSFEKSPLCIRVDKKSAIYFFLAGKGQAIGEIEFYEKTKLF